MSTEGLYTQVFGINPAAFFILPMLGKRTEEYPNFCDCWIKPCQFYIDKKSKLPMLKPKKKDFGKTISIFLQVGGDQAYNFIKELADLKASALYVEHFDDKVEPLYTTYIFNVPEKWKEDYDRVVEGKFSELSSEYQKVLYAFYPKLHSFYDNVIKNKSVDIHLPSELTEEEEPPKPKIITE